MDGNDFHILKAINVINPRVIILEYQDILGPKQSLTIPYVADFSAEQTPTGPNYYGASLSAFVKLLSGRGYRYIGSQSLGFNAFFVKEAIAKNIFPEASLAAAFAHPKVIHGINNRFPFVKHLKWEEV